MALADFFHLSVNYPRIAIGTDVYLNTVFIVNEYLIVLVFLSGNSLQSSFHLRCARTNPRNGNADRQLLMNGTQVIFFFVVLFFRLDNFFIPFPVSKPERKIFLLFRLQTFLGIDSDFRFGDGAQNS